MDEETGNIFRDLAKSAEQRKKLNPRLSAAEKQSDEATRLLLKKHSERLDWGTKLETGWILKADPALDDKTSASDDETGEKPSHDEPDHNGLS